MNNLLKHADCLDFLADVPSGSVDLVLTDYPYFISRKTGFKNGGGEQYNRIKISKDFGKWDKKESNKLDLRKVTEGLYRVLRQGGTFIAFYDIWKMAEMKEWCEGAGFRMLRVIEWLKSNPTPINQHKTYLNNAMEVAIVGAKGSKPIFNASYDRGTYNYPIPRASGGLDRHPTQKPLALFKELVEKHSNRGDLVLDCFLGSGTTAVAAVATGRGFIGCEADRGYYNTAVRRLSLA